MSDVKRWFARDPDKFAATAQVSVVLASDYDALTDRCAKLHAALDEIISLGTSVAARDNGPNYLANRMYHIADKARAAHADGGEQE
jgi:N12 class adenine-specific DNA methylase